MGKYYKKISILMSYISMNFEYLDFQIFPIYDGPMVKHNSDVSTKLFIKIKF